MNLVNKLLLIAIFLLISAVDSHALQRKAVDFKLNNWDGKLVSMQELKGKIVILTFSYAYCSAICPIITGRLSSLDSTIDSPKGMVYLHVSVDPATDTPERRKNYFNLYGIDALKDGRWMFVSGENNELARLWKFYGITMKKIKDKRLPEGYYIEYTPKVVVIDRNNVIRFETAFDFSEEELISQIQKLALTAPVIRFNNTRYEFGSVKKGEIVKHDFEFVNEGNGLLKIIDLIPA
ncbi:MAG: SCO family protein [Nitrospirota bacterium]